MAIKRLSFTADATDELQSVTLGTVTLQIRTQWVPRTESWYMSLYEADGTPIVTSKRLSTSYTPFGAHLLPEGLDGLLYVRGPAEYRKDDLGSQVQVIWYDAADLPVATASDLLVVL